MTACTISDLSVLISGISCSQMKPARRSWSLNIFCICSSLALPKRKSSVWMRAEKVLIIFTSHSVPNQYQSPIKPHKRFKQAQHTELFGKSIDGRGMNVWSGVHFLSIKNVWLVERDSRYIQISYRTFKSLCEFQPRVIRVLSFSLHVRNIFLCSPFRASFYFVLLKNYSFSLLHDASNVHTTRESLNKN